MRQNRIEFSYEVDRNVFMLYEYLCIVDNSIKLPRKYKNIINELLKELDKDIFKRPKNVDDLEVVFIDKMILTDVYEPCKKSRNAL